MCEACASLKTFSADCVLGEESTALEQSDMTYADLLATSSTDATVTVGGSYIGDLEVSGDSDWIAVNLVAGQTYTISLSGYGDTPVSDTYLRLFAPGSQDRATGTLVAYDDDGGAGYYSSLTYTATTSGTYYIDAASYADALAGGYLVEVGGYVAPDNTQVWTTQQIADQLTTGYWGGYQRSFNVGADNAITYNLSALDATYAGFARQALQTWSDIIGIQFVETTGSGEITFTQNGSMEAWSSSSRSGTTITGSTVNIASNWLTSQGTAYTQQTFIHEIGHALGLGHAGNYNGSASYGSDNLYANDSWQATVMSYFSQTQNTSIDASKAYLLTPMLADIAAIRDLYGTQGTTRTGDTVYGYNNNTGSSNFGANVLNDSGTNYGLTIVDDGGFDTIDMSGSAKHNRIDLTPGSISDTGGLTGNLTIGPDTIIESVIGGSGNDTITGNDADNVLFGNGGADTLNGGAGEDFLDGGAGADQIHGGDGDDTIIYDAADNWAAGAVTGGVGYDTLVFEPGTYVVGVWATLGLALYGFERYALVTYDGGSEAWSEIDDYYNTSDQHIERTTYFDDGTSEYIRYDYDNSQSWSEWVQTYDANRQLTGETYVSDNVATDVTLALGVAETGSFGNQFDGATDSDGIVDASFEATGTDLTLWVTGFDIDYETEVKVLLNGELLGYLNTSLDQKLSNNLFSIAADDQLAGQNIISFVKEGDPNLMWGVTNIAIAPTFDGDMTLTNGLKESGDFGNNFEGSADQDGLVTAAFNSTGHDIWLSLQGYDIDYDAEVGVLLNGESIGFLKAGLNNGLSSNLFEISASQLLSGENVLSFVKDGDPNLVWGVTDIVISETIDPDMTLTSGIIEAGKYGNLFDGATDDDGMVYAAFGGVESDIVLTVSGFDIDYANEVEVLLNGQSLGFLNLTANEGLGVTQFEISASQQSADLNVLTFFKNGDPGLMWGMTDILIENTYDMTLAQGVAETGKYGNHFSGASDSDGLVYASFEGQSQDMVLSVSGFDIDYETEVLVRLNGEAIGWLNAGPNEGYSQTEFLIAAGDQIAGDNIITFVKDGDPTLMWGVTDILIDTPDAAPQDWIF